MSARCDAARTVRIPRRPRRTWRASRRRPLCPRSSGRATRRCSWSTSLRRDLTRCALVLGVARAPLPGSAALSGLGGRTLSRRAGSRVDRAGGDAGAAGGWAHSQRHGEGIHHGGGHEGRRRGAARQPVRTTAGDAPAHTSRARGRARARLVRGLSGARQRGRVPSRGQVPPAGQDARCRGALRPRGPQAAAPLAGGRPWAATLIRPNRPARGAGWRHPADQVQRGRRACGGEEEVARVGKTSKAGCLIVSCAWRLILLPPPC